MVLPKATAVEASVNGWSCFPVVKHISLRGFSQPCPGCLQDTRVPSKCPLCPWHNRCQEQCLIFPEAKCSESPAHLFASSVAPSLFAEKCRCLWCFCLTCSVVINILQVAELTGTDFLLYLLYLSQLGLLFFLLLISTWWVNCVGKQPVKTENAENVTSSSAGSILQFISVLGACNGLDGKVCCVRGSCLWWCSLGKVLTCEQEWWALSWLEFRGAQTMCGF